MKDLNHEKKLVIVEGLSRILGQVVLYKILRKMGAPTYVAYLGTLILAHLRDVTDPYKPKVEKAFPR